MYGKSPIFARKDGGYMKEIRRYEHKNRRKYKLQAHLIFAMKYRRKVLYGVVSDACKGSILHVSGQLDCRIMAMETDRDHIHIMLSYPPELSISTIVHRMKQISTYEAWKKCYGLLNSAYPKKGKILWSDGYFCCSIGEASPKVVEQYIRNQG